jgi:hypothetical protein
VEGLYCVWRPNNLIARAIRGASGDALRANSLCHAIVSRTSITLIPYIVTAKVAINLILGLQRNTTLFH